MTPARSRRPAVLSTTAFVSTAFVTTALAVGALAAPAGAAPTPQVPAVTHSENELVPVGARWTQEYFRTADGTELHADVLLPERLGEGEQVPVVLSVGPYFGHSGEMGWQPRPSGPSSRFADLVAGGDLFERGYALVQVDTRGFGGSNGCLDFAGPAEQQDVQAAIDWAAAQPWSTGSVGMYGKSYDAITGLIGNNLGDDDLKAVVAQEPIWDMYRNIHSHGIPRDTATTIPAAYTSIALSPQPLDDSLQYLGNAAYEVTHPQCLTQYYDSYQDPDRDAPVWQPRDLAANAVGTDTPLFVTQGFLEWNTDAEGVEEFLANHTGPERGWLGQWAHVRGNDVAADGRLEMGREGWFAEVMSFYDENLKGIAPSTRYPAFAVQDSTGAWRQQEAWPLVEETVTADLAAGSYVDDGAASFWNTSEPVARDTRLTGTPAISLDSSGTGQTVVRLYDVAPDGSAVMFDEQAAALLPGTTSFELKSTDWTLAAGHALAVEIGSLEDFNPTPTPEQQALLDSSVLQRGDWVKSPSGQPVDVTRVQLELDLDDPADDVATQGARSVYSGQYANFYSTTLPVGVPTFRIGG